MIKAEQDNEQGIVAVEVHGNRDQNESELIAILISALSAFDENDIAEMLQVAVEYHNTGKPFDGQIN